MLVKLISLNISIIVSQRLRRLQMRLVNFKNLANTFNIFSVVLGNILNTQKPYDDYDDSQVIRKFCVMNVLKGNNKVNI